HVTLLVLIFFIVCFSFFFQAEDGIRDRNVTGVQTCALPICPAPGVCELPLRRDARRRGEMPADLCEHPRMYDNSRPEDAYRSRGACVRDHRPAPCRRLGCQLTGGPRDGVAAWSPAGYHRRADGRA